MTPISPKPPLPQSPGGINVYAIVDWAGQLTRSLSAYLADIARLLNDAVQVDGTTPMEGNLDMGGFSIINEANLFTSTKVTVFTASGTFTPDPKMLECIVTAYGGGGAGGGAPATAAAQVSAATGGNSGSKAIVRLTAAQIGASQTVTIGGGGAGVSGTTGGTGGTTTLGTLISAVGGLGGLAQGPAASVGAIPPASAQAATGDIKGRTQLATMAAYGNASQYSVNSNSGATDLGGGITGTVNAVGTAAAANSAAGGGGTLNVPSQAVRTGGAGASGLMIITEYLHA